MSDNFQIGKSRSYLYIRMRVRTICSATVWTYYPEMFDMNIAHAPTGIILLVLILISPWHIILCAAIVRAWCHADCFIQFNKENWLTFIQYLLKTEDVTVINEGVVYHHLSKNRGSVAKVVCQQLGKTTWQNDNLKRGSKRLFVIIGWWKCRIIWFIGVSHVWTNPNLFPPLQFYQLKLFMKCNIVTNNKSS